MLCVAPFAVRLAQRCITCKTAIIPHEMVWKEPWIKFTAFTHYAERIRYRIASGARPATSNSGKLMNDLNNHTEATVAIESDVKALLCDVQQCARNQYEQCEERIRQAPGKAMLGAIAVGYLLHRLPVRAIIITQMRVLSALTPPALLLCGAAKVYDFLRKR